LKERLRINNIASVGVIYRKTNPRQIFIDVKDGGYPIEAFRWMFCPIGGNWIGRDALKDEDTYDTLCRELSEELSLDREEVSTEEAKLLGLNPQETTYVVPKNNVPPTKQDRAELAHLKRVFAETAADLPFGDFLVTVPKSVLDQQFPGNTRPGYTSILSYWRIPIEEKEWTLLETLHKKYGNISIESMAVIVSLDEIIATQRHTCCGHDRIMQRFFESVGCIDATHYPLLDDICCTELHLPLGSYDQYLERYDIVRHP
jgi:hypothetical protein